MSRPVVIGALIVAALVSALGWIRAEINYRAEVKLLQNEVAALRQDGATLRGVLADYRKAARDSAQVLQALREEQGHERQVISMLRQQAAGLREQLAAARDSATQADSLLLAARHAVDTTLLKRPVLHLVLAERRAGERAKAEADACNAALGNCDEQVASLESQIGGLEHQIQIRDVQVSAADSVINDLEAYNLRADSLITRMERQLNPGWFHRLSKNWPTVLGAAAAGALAAMILSGG